MENLSYRLSCIKKDLYTFLFFFLFFVLQSFFSFSALSLFGDSTPAHSPSGKELNPSSQDDARFSGRCTLA